MVRKEERKKKRKFKSDDIRKKIKSRFHKALKNIINDSLKAAGSLKFFDFFPQCFTGNIAKKINSQSFEKTYEELLSTDFSLELSKGKPDKTSADYRKYVKNKQVLEYLEKHKEISKNSGFDIIKKKKYKELLKMYFSSKEFEDSILRLKQENAEPIKKEINTIENKFVSKVETFVKKEEKKVEEKKPEEKIKELEDKLAELTFKYSQLEQENENLKKELEKWQ